MIPDRRAGIYASVARASGLGHLQMTGGLVGDCYEDALSCARIYPVVGLGDPVERDRFAARDGQRSFMRRGGQVDRGLLLSEWREVVAAEQPDREVGEEHRPEGKLGAIGPGGVGGDDGVGCRDCGVEVCVVGEGNLDDAVYATWRERANGVDRIRLIERHRVRDGWIDLVKIGPVHHGADDGRAGPSRNLRRHRADNAQDALDQDRLAFHRSVAEDGTMRVMPGIPRQAPTSSLTSRGSAIACTAGRR